MVMEELQGHLHRYELLEMFFREVIQVREKRLHQMQLQLVATGKEKVQQYQPGFIAEAYQQLWSKFKN